MGDKPAPENPGETKKISVSSSLLFKGVPVGSGRRYRIVVGGKAFSDPRWVDSASGEMVRLARPGLAVKLLCDARGLDSREALFRILTLAEDSNDEVIAELSCRVEEGLAQVEWICPDELAEQHYYFVCESRGVTATSPLLEPEALFGEVRWSKNEALFGDELVLSASLLGEITEPVKFVIWEHDQDGIHDEIVTLEATVEGTDAQATWTVEFVPDFDDTPVSKLANRLENLPEFFFEAVSGAHRKCSGHKPEELSRVRHVVSARLVDEGFQPVHGRVRAELIDGRKVESEVGDDGLLRIDSVDWGRVILSVASRNDLQPTRIPSVPHPDEQVTAIFRAAER